ARSEIVAVTENFDMHLESQANINIKVKLSQGDNNEHFWLSDLEYKNDLFYGTINNYPAMLTNYKFGDSVSVKPEEISDWFIIMGSNFLGGFTMKVTRNRMNEESRADFDNSFPYILMSENKE
ncbi:MAG: DUF2314 domain-containing protein, partial [Saccharospirillaceae bacterium]|nr:DUF2314 domain-containing protein [Saccharospirillaceae bacterium]